MSRSPRPTRPSWQVADSLVPRPEYWMCAALVLGMLLTEVWQTSHLAQICLSLDQVRTASVQANARLEYLRAAAERRSTRAELVPLASSLGLAPAEAKQLVLLPSEYLADDRTTPRDEGSASLLAWAERASGALLPEASAGSRVTR